MLPSPQRLIKAHAMRRVGARVTFEYEDLARQCDEYVAQAHRQGEAIVAEAASRSEEFRRRAYDEGHAAGQHDGLAAAQGLIDSRAAKLAAEQTHERLRTVLPALEALVGSLEVERERWLTVWESAAVRLSAAIAEKIVRRELAQRPELTIEIVREALQLAAGRPQITLRLNPKDLEQLRASEPIRECLSRVGEAVLLPDDAISRGGCLIETRHGAIDARIETQLLRIVDELLDSDRV
jgi:flagellar assembly protein FliH